MNAELAALAATRRADGQPCNPMRDGLTDVDWLTEEEIQLAHVLGLQDELAGMAGMAA